MKEILKKAFASNELNEAEIFSVVNMINNETTDPLCIAALLGAISAKNGGVGASELAFFANALKKCSKQINLESQVPLVDVCGTGGDCIGTFNISTAVSFVVAACNVGTVKHGARSVSSACGSADVLEALGIKIEVNQNNLQNIFNETGMVFLYAPSFNKAMAQIKKIRNTLSIPTIFNLLGPLTNPVKLDYQVVGVWDETKMELVINALKKMGLKSAMVVRSKDGLDELSTTSENIIYHLKDGIIKKQKLPPLETLGLEKAEIKDILGKDAKYNAEIILEILNGQKGAKRDIVLLNASGALVTSGVAKDFKEGVEIARNAIDSKKALNVLERLKNVSGKN